MKSKLFTIALLLWCFLPLVTLAVPPPGGGLEEAPPAFQALIGIPGISDALINTPEFQFGDYINALYRLSISIAALLAVIKIIAAGVKYMFDDIVTHKQQAKDDIQGALIGLLVILGAFIILNTINTDITKNAVLVDPLELNGSDPGLIEQIRNNQIGLFVSAQERCDQKYTTTCLLKKGLSQETCEDAKGGVFIAGSTLNVLGEIVGEGNYRNYCYYPEGYAPGHDIVLKSDQVLLNCSGKQTCQRAGCSVTGPYDCSAARTSCTDSGRRTVSESGSTIICEGRTPEQIENDNEIAARECSDSNRSWNIMTLTCSDFSTNQKIFPDLNSSIMVDESNYTNPDYTSTFNSVCSNEYGTGWLFNFSTSSPACVR